MSYTGIANLQWSRVVRFLRWWPSTNKRTRRGVKRFLVEKGGVAVLVAGMKIVYPSDEPDPNRPILSGFILLKLCKFNLTYFL